MDRLTWFRVRRVDWGVCPFHPKNFLKKRSLKNLGCLGCPLIGDTLNTLNFWDGQNTVRNEARPGLRPFS